MARKTTTIKVESIEGKKFEVELKEELSWGEAREIQGTMTSNANMKVKEKGEDVDFSLDGSAYTEYTYKTLEVAIAEIENEDGEDIEFSKEWVNNLTRKSGDELFNTANGELGNQKKS